MTSNHPFSFIGVLMSVFLLASCVEDIDMDTGAELPVVVDCVLKMDTVQTLRLYHMKKLNADGYEPVTDVRVELQRVTGNDSQETVAEFHHSEGLLWETRFEPGFGEKYRLSVTRPGKEEISATTTFPEDMRLVLHQKSINDGTGFYDSTRDTTYLQAITAEVAAARMVSEQQYVSLILKELGYIPSDVEFPIKAYIPAGRKACKMWIYPRRDTIVVYPPANWTVWGPPFSFSDLPFIPSPKPYCDLVATDHPCADNFNLTPGKVTDWEIVHEPANTQYKRGFLYYQYPINYTQWIPQMCPDLPLHKGFVRIDQPEGFTNGLTEEDLKTSYQFSQSSFFILGDYSNYRVGVEPCLIEVRFLSDEYDAFLRELHIRNQSRDDFILSTYDTENIYSNIQGGVGIFGAENVTWAEDSYKRTIIVRQ